MEDAAVQLTWYNRYMSHSVKNLEHNRQNKLYSLGIMLKSILSNTRTHFLYYYRLYEYEKDYFRITYAN